MAIPRFASSCFIWLRSVATILVPVQLTTPLGPLSMFTTLTTFGTPLDVTIEELAVELFFPADDESDAVLHRAGALAAV